MNSYFPSLYLTALILGVLLLIGGYESTLRIFLYLDILLRYQIIKVRMWFMRKKLEKQLNLPPKDWSDFHGKF